MNLFGDFGSGSTGSQIVAQDCSIGDVQGVYGVASNCHLAGTIILQANEQFVLSDVASAIPGLNSPIIDMNSGVPTGLSLRRYSGGMRIINCDHVDDVATLEYVAGKCNISSGCTDGIISVRGVVDVTDNSSGTTVETDALWHPHEESEKISQILGLSQSNFKMTNQTYTVSGSLETAIIKTYPTATALNANVNEIATYHVAATYDVSGLLDSYKVTKQ